MHYISITNGSLRPYDTGRLSEELQKLFSTLIHGISANSLIILQIPTMNFTTPIHITDIYNRRHKSKSLILT